MATLSAQAPMAKPAMALPVISGDKAGGGGGDGAGGGDGGGGWFVHMTDINSPFKLPSVSPPC